MDLKRGCACRQGVENPGILEQVTEEAALELKHKTSDFVRSIVAELVGPMGAIS